MSPDVLSAMFPVAHARPLCDAAFAQGRRLERRVGRLRDKLYQGSLGCPNLHDHARDFQAATQWRRRYTKYTTMAQSNVAQNTP